MEKVNVKDFGFDELRDFFVGQLGLPKFRAKQVWQWLWEKGVTDFGDMTNLSKLERTELEASAYIGKLNVRERQVSQVDGTEKVLFELPDGNLVETVIMKHDYGNSVCVSTQVGCRMGCGFCASTLTGLERNLKAWEIYDQVMGAQKLAGARISSIVIMGMGEPLDNYAEVLKFIRLIIRPDTLNIGQRHITLSTSGLVPKIADLAQEDLAITLSISLHATDNETRSKIMPINRSYPIEDLLEVCRSYLKATGRRITFEYSLIAGFNDSEAEAHKLGRLLRGMLCHVNLIPINPVAERGLARPQRDRVLRFRDVVEEYRVEVTIRRELGTDIDAACGQLRNRFKGDT